MFYELTRKWWVLVLSGVCAILFGVTAFVWPSMTLLAMLVIFGIYCLVDGVLAFASAFVHSGGTRFWWQMIVAGFCSLTAGIFAFVWPAVTIVVLLVLIAVWAIARGVFEIGAAFHLRRLIRNEWLLLVAGVLSILFGAVLLIQPAAGILAVVWIVGAYALVRGVILGALGLELRNAHIRRSNLRHSALDSGHHWKGHAH